MHLKISALVFTMVAVIASMAAILVHERQRIREIEVESAEIRQVRRDINTAHRHITRLATLGESVIGWKEADSTRYCALRLRTDSLLQALKPHCRDYVRPAQIDLFADNASPGNASPIVFSPDAQAVMNAGRELWRYYHAQPGANPNAAFYDIRLYFQGVNDKGKMNTGSEDERYNQLMVTLRKELKTLAAKIEPKVYEYGFLLR